MAQLVEQLIRNQQAVGSSPTTSSKLKAPQRWFLTRCGVLLFVALDSDYFLTTFKNFRDIYPVDFSRYSSMRWTAFKLSSASRWV